jgi:hypothetical protein
MLRSASLAVSNLQPGIVRWSHLHRVAAFCGHKMCPQHYLSVPAPDANAFILRNGNISALLF